MARKKAAKKKRKKPMERQEDLEDGVYRPSPAEIRRECLKFQQSRDHAEEVRRLGGTVSKSRFDSCGAAVERGAELSNSLRATWKGWNDEWFD